MKPLRGVIVSASMLAIVAALPTSHLSAAPGTGTLFGTDAFNGNLITINPSTGLATVVGNMGVGPVPALAVDPLTGTIYAGGGGGVPNIYTVNQTTGAATLLGDTGLGLAAVAALDVHPTSGMLYAAVNIAGAGGTGADHLAIIDKATGAATIVGPFGSCTDVSVPSTGGGSCTIEGMEGIAFDSVGNLWGSHRVLAAGPVGLYRINVATGAATFVAPFVDGSGEAPSGGVASLQFACNGTLYGGTAFPVPPATDGGNLISILTTGTPGFFTTIGNAVPDASLGALAFQTACPTARIPSVSAWGTVLLGLLFVAHLAWTMRRRRAL
jgi:hypothetical protein